MATTESTGQSHPLVELAGQLMEPDGSGCTLSEEGQAELRQALLDTRPAAAQQEAAGALSFFAFILATEQNNFSGADAIESVVEGAWADLEASAPETVVGEDQVNVSQEETRFETFSGQRNFVRGFQKEARAGVKLWQLPGAPQMMIGRHARKKTKLSENRSA